MPKGNIDKVKRRSIMLPDSTIEDMAQIREETGAQSDSEVLRRAFKLYKKIVADVVRNGNELTITNRQTGEKKVIIVT